MNAVKLDSRSRASRVALAVVSTILTVPAWASAQPAVRETAAERIGFIKHVIDTDFQSEGATIADMNNDGKLDLVAGSYWWAAPGWKRHRFRKIADVGQPNPERKYYKDETFDFADDLDGDGDTDVLTVHMHQNPVRWYENPGTSGSGIWKNHLICRGGLYEAFIYRDIDGDGKRDIVTTTPAPQVSWYARPGDPTGPWAKHVIGDRGGASHGLGVGDMNDDGKPDVLVNGGWYQAPADPRTSLWRFHPLIWLKRFYLADCYDIDGDGDNDLIGASPHNYGIWWWHKSKSPSGFYTFHRRTIDDSVSQNHSRRVIDLNGDGVLDYVTGKRYYAHNGHDPGAHDPVVFAWYQPVRGDKTVEWVRHLIDTQAGPGLDFEVADVDADGDLDIFIAAKKGCYYYEQVPENKLYKTLFNGKDLTGGEGDPKLWSVRDGMIVGKTYPGFKQHSYLMSKDGYSDFEFIAKARLIDGKGNSGIQFRSRSLPDHLVKGPQADMGDGWWGSLYDVEGRAVMHKNEKIDHIDTKGWIEYRIVAVGSHIQIFLDGVKTVDIIDPDGGPAGKFGFQLHPGPVMTVQFKDILVRQNPPHIMPRLPLGGRPARWWVAGPFPNQDDKGFDYANPPEKGFDKNAKMAGKGGATVRWKQMNTNDAGYIDLMALLGERSSAYAFTYVRSPIEQTAELQMGSDDGIRAWVNGELVHSNNADRGAAPAQDRATIRLKKGRNEILIKITQNAGGAGFFVHLANARKVKFALEP